MGPDAELGVAEPFRAFIPGQGFRGALEEAINDEQVQIIFFILRPNGGAKRGDHYQRAAKEWFMGDMHKVLRCMSRTVLR